MTNSEITIMIARNLTAEKRARLDARVDEIARDKNMSIVERAKFRARAVEALDNGELII